MKKSVSILLLAALICSLFAGCSIETKIQSGTEESKYSFYYLNASETVLKEEPYEPKEETTEFMVKDLMQKLGKKEVPDGGVSLLPEEVSINSYDVQDDLLVIDFSKEYSDMSKVREIMTRAGIVQTLLQVPDITKICFTVAGQALKNSRNEEIGEMTGKTFAEYSGKDTESYRYDTFTLYFADKSGKKLVKEVRNVYYRRSLPKERIVLEQLAKGPMEEGHYPTISEHSSVLSVITADKICYVNLDDGFLETGYNVAENIPIYSIVNSIVDNTDAVKVQFSINGESNRVYRETINFNTIFEKNEELVEQ